MIKVWRKNQKWGSISWTFLGTFGRVLKTPDWKWQNIPFTQLRSPSCGASVLVHPRSGPGQRGSGYQQKKSMYIFVYKDGIVCIFAMSDLKGEYQAVDCWLAGGWDGHGHEDADDGGARSSRGGLPHPTTSKATRRLLTCWWLFQRVNFEVPDQSEFSCGGRIPGGESKSQKCTIISFTMLPRILCWSIRTKSLPGWALYLYTIHLEGEAWL